MKSKLITVLPVKTEKTFKLANTGIYTFAVIDQATKAEIVDAIKKIYGVDVTSYKSLTRRAKNKVNWRTRKKFQTPSYKKVYVQLAKGQQLEIYK
ncbi:MAG: 50S ribosomal protein L23 [Candidatus Dojkabacteria bacterium]|nr:MAG: 50S ribosomal protein L23 [Candidatus Dojkabacteria bacterium]